jgi:hypothetical protein
MHRMRALAAGLALAVSLGGGAMALAPAALAAPTAAAGVGSFRTWSAAKSAAGFGLRKPNRSYGLGLGPIVVTPCQAKGKLKKRDVIASYGSPLHRLLSIDQNNSGGACGGLRSVTKVRTYRVQGHRAVLYTSAHNLSLFLVWTKHGKYYVASSHNEPRSKLVGFARSLRIV